MIVNLTSSRVEFISVGTSVVFRGDDILSGQIVQPDNTFGGTRPVVVRLFLSREARESSGLNHYDVILGDITNQPTWSERIETEGAQNCLTDLTPLFRKCCASGGGGSVEIIAGDGIEVDSTDPAAPIVSASVDGVTVGFNGLGQLEVPAGGGGYVPVSRTIGTTAPLTGGGDLSANRTIAIPQANGLTDGFLDSADWTAFNAKQPAGNYLTALTGDVTAAGPGSAPATLASIITAGGPTGSATVAPIITYDAKGRLTTVSSATITPAVGSITGLGTGVGTALAQNADSATGFVTQTGGDGRYTPLAPVFLAPYTAGSQNFSVTSLANVNGTTIAFPDIGFYEYEYVIEYNAALGTTGSGWGVNFFAGAAYDYFSLLTFMSVSQNGAMNTSPSRTPAGTIFNSSSRFTSGNTAIIKGNVNITTPGSIRAMCMSEVGGSNITVVDAWGFIKKK